jgi:hypothetical protein
MLRNLSVVAAAIAALSAGASAALPKGLYGLTGENSILVTRVHTNGTIETVSSSTTSVGIPGNLVSAPTADGTIFALGLAAGVNLSVFEIDMATAKLQKNVPLPYECGGIVGAGNQMAYAPDDNAVWFVYDANSSDPAPHAVAKVDMATGAVTKVAEIPGTRYWDFLGNFAGYSPKSRTFWFQLRNYTTASSVAVFVNVDTNAVTLRTGCLTDNGAYDPQTDSFITMGTFRNGTDIQHVWRAQMSIAADGSSDCVMGRVLYNEASKEGVDVVSVGAFDPVERQFYLYSAASISDPLGLLAIDWDTGALKGPVLPVGGNLPDSLVYLP